MKNKSCICAEKKHRKQINHDRLQRAVELRRIRRMEKNFRQIFGIGV